LTYSRLTLDDKERMGDSHFVKLFRLSQLSLEYLIYTQNYLQTLTASLNLKYREAQQETLAIKEQLAEVET